MDRVGGYRHTSGGGACPASLNAKGVTSAQWVNIAAGDSCGIGCDDGDGDGDAWPPAWFSVMLNEKQSWKSA